MSEDLTGRAVVLIMAKDICSPELPVLLDAFAARQANSQASKPISAR